MNTVLETTSKKSVEKEERVADEINANLSSDNVIAKRIAKNNTSDVQVTIEDRNKFFIEVKMNDFDSPVAKYTCKVEGNQLKFEFKKTKGNNSEDFDELIRKPLEQSEIITTIQRQLGEKVSTQTEYLKEVLSENIDNLIKTTKQNEYNYQQKKKEAKDEFDAKKKKIEDNNELNDEQKKYAIYNAEQIMKQKIGRSHSLIDHRGKSNESSLNKKLNNLNSTIKSLKFPDIFNSLNDFFEIYDQIHSNRYSDYRKQLKGCLKEDVVKILIDNSEKSEDRFYAHEDRKSRMSKPIKDMLEIIFESDNISTQTNDRFDKFMESYDDFGRELEKYNYSLIDDFTDDPTFFVQMMSKISRLYASYNNILKKCNEYNGEKNRENVSSISEMRYWQKIRYTYESFFEVQKFDEMDYDPDKKWRHGITLHYGEFGELAEKEKFDEMVNIVVNYYLNLGVRYFQINDNIYTLSKEDPLGLKKSDSNKVHDFKESFKKIIYNLFLTINDNGMNLTFFMIFKERIGSHSNVSFDTKDTTKDFPETEINESILEGTKTSDTATDKFEIEVADGIRRFLDSQNDEKYRNLGIEHYEGSDRKYWSDIKITNPNNDKNIWVEAKLNKYSNLGGPSFKYSDGEWTCTTTDDENPLTQFYLDALKEHSQKFISFCKDYLKKDDIKLPTDLSEELVDAWKRSGSVDDTDNDVQFITDKIVIDDFGHKVAEYYQSVKLEPVYYMQVADDLYIIDSNYNPLNLITRSGEQLKTIAEAHRIGRIQFRMKGLNKSISTGDKKYYSINMDVKILADKDNLDNEYSCSFLDEEKWPVIRGEQMDIGEVDESLEQQIESILEEYENGKYAWHVSNVEPDKIRQDGFKSGIGGGATDTNLFDDLYEQEYPRNYLFISKEPWDDISEQKFKYAYKIDITDLDLYPDFGMLLENGAYHEEGSDDEGYVFWWKDRDIESMKNLKLKRLIQNNDGQITTNQMLGGETDEGEGFPNALYEALGSAVVDGDKVNSQNRIVEVVTRENVVSESEDLKLLTNVSEDLIKNILDNEKIENTRYNRAQFTKYFGIKEMNWCVLASNENNLAIAALIGDNPYDGCTFINEIQTLKKGYGRKLLEIIVDKYKGVWLTADPTADDKLFEFYRKTKLFDEYTLPKSCYGTPLHVFYTKDVKEDELRRFVDDTYGEDDITEHIERIFNEDVTDDVKELDLERGYTADDKMEIEGLTEADKEIGGEESDMADEIHGTKIWIDDIREAPYGFKWFKTVRDFIGYIDEHGTDGIELIDTDHDAGDYQNYGGDYIRCFDYLDFIGAKNITVHIHSANPVGANNIRRIISKNKEENNWREVRNTDE